MVSIAQIKASVIFKTFCLKFTEILHQSVLLLFL